MKTEIKILIGIVAIALFAGRMLLMKDGVGQNQQREKLDTEIRKFNTQRNNETTRKTRGDDESKRKFEEIEASRKIDKQKTKVQVSKDNSNDKNNSVDKDDSIELKLKIIRNELQEKFSHVIYKSESIYISKETKEVSVIMETKVGGENLIRPAGTIGSIDFNKNGEFYFIPLKWNGDKVKKNHVDEKIVTDLRYKNIDNKIKRDDLIVCVDWGPSSGRDKYSFKEK